MKRTLCILAFNLCISITFSSFASDKQKACEEIVRIYQEKHISSVKEKNPNLFTSEVFYNSKLDSCIYARIAKAGALAVITDVSQTIIRDGVSYSNLFYCDADGADSILLEKVQAYKGNVFNVNYKEYMDNGEGGLPRTLKTPSKPYNRQKCEELYQGWLDRLR